MVYLLLLVGVFLLLIGGDFLVKSAASLAKKLNISPFLIGVTVVSFGTSAPELIVSLKAAFNGSSGIAIGNVIGSNIANLALVLGITVLIRPIVLDPKKLRFSWFAMLVASLMFLGFSIDGILDRVDGLFLISGLILFLILSIRKRDDSFVEEELEKTLKTNLIPVYFIFGAAGLYYGSELLVDSAITIAKSFGISEFIIGVSVVALGTSLPELVTSIIAIIKGQSSISVGNLIGSNVFNIFAVLGITSAVNPLKADSFLIAIDLPIMLGVTLLTGLFLLVSKKLGRVEGLLLITIYIMYIGSALI
ncbi:MAG: calcium/sodium antiporter [Bacteroidia bacterium]|jgi:cation:H+ antiporter|nr:calcium/sodium antiporter [Bacteroidia bacterium]